MDFINSIHELGPDSPNFISSCLSKINEVKNVWIDPIIPNDIVTDNDVCGAFKELFNEMKKKSLIDYQSVQIYSYVLIYQLYINS